MRTVSNLGRRTSGKRGRRSRPSWESASFPWRSSAGSTEAICPTAVAPSFTLPPVVSASVSAASAASTGTSTAKRIGTSEPSSGESDGPERLSVTG